MNLFVVMSMLGGLVLFLYGINALGDGLKRLSGNKMEAILGYKENLFVYLFLLK